MGDTLILDVIKIVMAGAIGVGGVVAVQRRKRNGNGESRHDTIFLRLDRLEEETREQTIELRKIADRMIRFETLAEKHTAEDQRQQEELRVGLRRIDSVLSSLVASVDGSTRFGVGR